jgi:hypothetical protein
MKINTDKVFVTIEAENKYDIFQLGQICGDMHKHGFENHVLLSPDESSSFGDLSIKKEDFISYIIKNLNENN